MNRKLSSRHDVFFITAGIEMPSGGGQIGVSTAVRKYWRNHFKSVPGMQGPNDQINFLVATDFAQAKPIHRFLLKSNEIGEIRSSGKFFYIAAIRQNKRYDIIVIQASMKEVPEEVKKSRLDAKWIEDVLSGKIKRRK